MFCKRLIAQSWVVFAVSLLFALMAPLSAAQFKVTDNFNRPDGAPGLGRSVWGNGAQISVNQLETFGETSVAGGIQRTLDVTFPLKFSFNFSTDDPPEGGWLIAFNALKSDLQVPKQELLLYQYSGSSQVCTRFQKTSGGTSDQCANVKPGQRDFTKRALITGTVNADFSAKIKITYNDGALPTSVIIINAAPVGANQTPLGSLFFFGNSSRSYGPHYFDNFSLTLM